MQTIFSINPGIVIYLINNKCKKPHSKLNPDIKIPYKKYRKRHLSKNNEFRKSALYFFLVIILRKGISLELSQS